MKYPSPKEHEKLKSGSFLINDFMHGINDDTGPLAQPGDLLKDCVNMEYKEKALTTRKGFCALPSSLVEPSEYSDFIYLPFTVTDTVYYDGGVPKNPAYYCTGYSDGATLNFYLADGEGNITDIGGIDFYRVDAEHFYIPANVFFMIGQPVSGNGVFAFVYRKSRDDFICEVYEANENFDGWQEQSDAFYVPTVLVNGRGEQYHLARRYSTISLPEPRRVEELNLVCGTYKCYFSSDHFSSSFRLPYGNISLFSNFYCRVYSEAGVYTEWQIPPACDYADATIDGDTVRLYLDRTLGVARFYCGGEDYGVPEMEAYEQNNIVFTATVETDDFFKAIVSSRGAVPLNNRIYCFGGSVKSNCVFCSKSNNPFYFPVSSKIFLGDGTTPVTALKVQNGKLIAFKPGETYRVITSAENEAPALVDLPETSGYIKGDVLSAQTIDNRIGCSAEETIRLCGNRLVWLSGDGDVYALATTTYGNTTNIFRVSVPLGGRLKEALKETENVFAVTNGGQYMLFAGESVFVMNHRVRGFGYSKTYYAQDEEIKSPAWYIWKLPPGLDFKVGAVINGNPVFISKIPDESLYYASVIDGAADTYLIKEEGEINTVSADISSGFKTKMLDCGIRHKLKSLCSVMISSLGKSFITLELSDGKRTVKRSLQTENGFSYVPIDFGMPGVRLLCLSLSGEEAFSVESVNLIIKTLAGAG